MKNDTDFLNSTILSKYFRFALNSDPFLICMSEGDTEKGKYYKTVIPFDEEMQDNIKNW